MPLYEFECSLCGEEFEKILSSNAAAPPCPGCGKKKTVRKFSIFGMKSGGKFTSSSGGDCSGCSAKSCSNCK